MLRGAGLSRLVKKEGSHLSLDVHVRAQAAPGSDPKLHPQTLHTKPWAWVGLLRALGTVRIADALE
jgi:hypothetical protein